MVFAQGEPAVAGIWQVTVTGVDAGDAAAALVARWHAKNPPPPGGLAYLVVRVRVENLGAAPHLIHLADFLATGSDGILRRPPAIVIGDEPLQGPVEPGQAREGVVPLLVNDPAPATLWFESTQHHAAGLSVIASLGSETVVPAFEMTGGISSLGESATVPARFGEAVDVGSWRLVLAERIEGQTVHDMAGRELQALGDADPADIPNWLAIRGTLTNVSDAPAYFSEAMLEITDEAGEPWDDILTLTPPAPELSAYLLPGASLTGWAAFQRTDYGTGGEVYSTAHMVRLTPTRLTGQSRYIALPDMTDPSPSADTADADDAAMEPLAVMAGDRVVTTEEAVNLRAEPAIEGSIVTILERGTVLIVTGDPVAADDYRWVPVMVEESGEAGFVVEAYLAPAS